MYDYFIGKITSNSINYVVIEVGNIGYKVFTPNPFVFKEDNIEKLYLYNHIREDENSLYGFKTEEERNLFLRLIDVKGLGPKVALPMLATGSINGIIDAIDRENILYLTKFPKIGDKLARQIILDLKGKLVSLDKNINNENEELTQVLESLGYKSVDIKRVINQVNKDANIENQIKEALRLLLK
jgi:Holliday junction DNA helicase RuvA